MVYDTVGLDDCPIDKWRALDPQKLAKQVEVPAPARRRGTLTVRIYWPTVIVLDGSYKLPPVRPAD